MKSHTRSIEPIVCSLYKRFNCRCWTFSSRDIPYYVCITLTKNYISSWNIRIGNYSSVLNYAAIEPHVLDQIAHTEHQTSSVKSLQLLQISRLDIWFKRYCMLCIRRYLKTMYHHGTYVMKLVTQTMSCRDRTKHGTWNRIHGASNRLCVVSLNVSTIEIGHLVREISHIIYA